MNKVLLKAKSETPSEGASRAALHLISEIERAQSEMLAADARSRKLGEALSLILGDVPQGMRAAIQARFDRARSAPYSPSRSGEVHDNVVSLFRNSPKREWTIPEIQIELEKSGAEADPKALYNAINYLAKIGRLRRVSRGQYLVVGIGVGVELDIGPNDGTRRISEHD